MAKEEKIVVCRQHWAAFLLDGVICAFFLCLAIASMGMKNPSVGYTVFLFLVAAFFAARIFVSYMFTYIVLTKTKIVGHIGFIKSKILTTPLSKVQNIGLSNGLLGKIFGYHTVTISDAGGAGVEFVFPRMAKAQEFVDAVQNEIAVL